MWPFTRMRATPPDAGMAPRPAIIQQQPAHEAMSRGASPTTVRKMRAAELERLGEIDSALGLYEDAVADGTADRFIYGRLVELYRQRGEASNERRVITRALDALGSDPVARPLVDALRRRAAQLDA